MPVRIEPTPNPNAMKFSVGQPVGGPVTITDPGQSDDTMVKGIFELGGVQQIFMTSDFISVTKLPDANWNDLMDPIQAAIESVFG